MKKFYNITNKKTADLKAFWEEKKDSYEGLSYSFDTEIKKVEDKDEKVKRFRFIFSTENEDRHKEIVKQNFDLKHFKKNPVFLNSHNYHSIKDVIGKVEKLKIKDGVLQGEVIFFTDNEMGLLAEKAVEQGFIKATSIGFIPLQFSEDWRTIEKSELLEISLVSVPSNREALYQEKQVKEEEEEPKEEEVKGDDKEVQEEVAEEKSIDYKEELEKMSKKYNEELKKLAKSLGELVEEKANNKKREIYRNIRKLLE